MRPQINWIDRLTTDQKVGGSSPSGRTIQKINCYYLYNIITSIREVAQFGRAFGLGPKGRRFKSCLPDHYNNGPLAQLGEHLPCTQGVDGSIPLGSTIMAGQLSWLERSVHTRKVESSTLSPATIFIYGPLAQLVRASGS